MELTVLDHIISFFSNFNAIEVISILMTFLAIMLVFTNYKLLTIRSDKFDKIQQQLQDQNEKHKELLDELQKKINDIFEEVDKLYDELKDGRSSQNISDIKDTLEKLKQDTMEIKTLLLVWLKGGK